MSKEAFLREFMDVIWNKKNFDQVEQYLHHEYTVYLDPGDDWEGKTLSHSEYINRMKEGSFKSFPDMHFEITSAIEEEHHVAITWILTGTNLGTIGEHLPTKNTINTKGMTIYHFQNNRISGHTQIFDRITVMKQLGFM